MSTAPDRSAGDKVDRLFQVLAIVAAAQDGASLTLISKQAGIPLSSCHNLLQSMVEAQVLTSGPARRYQLGPRTIHLAFRVLESLEICRLARPHLMRLAEEIGFDVYLAGRSGSDVVYLERFAGRTPVNLDIRLGEPVYLHATAVGKIFAALDPEMAARLQRMRLPKLTRNTTTDLQTLEQEFVTIRKKRLSISRGESFEEVLGYAAPIMDLHGHIRAAVHISALRSHLRASQTSLVVDRLQHHALSIERDLGVAHETQPLPADIDVTAVPRRPTKRSVSPTDQHQFYVSGNRRASTNRLEDSP